MKPAQEGDQWQQGHWTKATYTSTALVEDERDEDGIQNIRKVTAGAREQKDTTSKLVEAKMKTTAEPHVKEELNHMQARGRPGSERTEGVSSGLAEGSRYDSVSQGRGCRYRVVCRGRDPDAKQEAAEGVIDVDLSSKTLSRGGIKPAPQ